jgi:hypothetical protein
VGDVGAARVAEGVDCPVPEAWGLAGAEAVLKLRALRSNGDFNDYWAWHEKQEYTRNHQARYRDELILAA